MEETPVNGRKEYIEEDRRKGLDPELFWYRHGIEHMDAEQIRKILDLDNAANAVCRTLAGAGNEEKFLVLNEKQQIELARTILTEDNHLERAIKDGAESGWIQATIFKAGLNMEEAMVAMQKAKEIFELHSEEKSKATE